MKKLIAIVTIAQIVGLMSISFGASGKCTVKKIEGDNLVVDCGKNAGNIKVGDKIKIKTMKKTAVEGC